MLIARYLGKQQRIPPAFITATASATSATRQLLQLRYDAKKQTSRCCRHYHSLIAKNAIPPSTAGIEIMSAVTAGGRRRIVTRTRSSGSDGLGSGGSSGRSRKGRATSSAPEAEPCRLTIDDTPLGRSKPGSALLDGLDVYSVPSATTDRHPLTVYGISSSAVQPVPHDKHGEGCRRPILLLHGRTWSSVPVYHLLGGPRRRDAHLESRSLMEALYATGDLQPYTMDFRGFGGTPPDSTGTVQPHVCVGDAEAVLGWIADRHGIFLEGDRCHSSSSSADRGGDDGASAGSLGSGEEVEYCRKCELPALLGWSQGALVAQLVAQKSPHLLSKLVLYGSIYDPLVRYPRRPLYTAGGLIASLPPNGTGDGTGDGGNSGGKKDPEQPRVRNDHDGAIEDFTIEGTIEPEPAKRFAEAALESDPYKARWTGLHEFNNVDPARVHVPTLVVAGDQDPYCPLRAQQELFANLGRGADRSWSILSDADHAVHLLDGRDRFVRVVRSFVENTKMRDEGD